MEQSTYGQFVTDDGIYLRHAEIVEPLARQISRFIRLSSTYRLITNVKETDLRNDMAVYCYTGWC